MRAVGESDRRRGAGGAAGAGPRIREAAVSVGPALAQIAAGPLRRCRRAQTTAALASFALLAVLSAATGMTSAGLLAGTVCIVGTWSLYTAAQRRRSRGPAGPADAVTLARSGLIAGVAALVAEGLVSPGAAPNWLPAALAAVALVLDAVDGAVARRTDTASALGARFDMEADALLLLVLSVHVAAAVLGWWVLAIGLLRYLFAGAGLLVPRLRAPLPPSDARRAVAALQGIALVAVTPAVLPYGVATAVAGGALALLLWSFGRDTVRLLRAGRTGGRGGNMRAGAVPCGPSDSARL
ncbi:CDP-alcohol phosphatidyltransferase family protein [Streptomonospora alba]|uniref:CDP-alcohol phosphatidyltransferase family protein n=1 Tax=Streptomonospora alba TaxID=183763 RepID=UPI000A03D354